VVPGPSNPAPAIPELENVPPRPIFWQRSSEGGASVNEGRGLSQLADLASGGNVMETRKSERTSRRSIQEVLAVAAAVLAVVSVVTVIQLPRIAMGSDASGVPVAPSSVVGAKHTILSKLSGGGAGFFNVNASTCYRAGNGLDECNVTLAETTNCGSSCGWLEAVNYSIVGSPNPPTTFYFISANPGLPFSLAGYGCSSGCGPTFSLWFHVIPVSGHIAAFLEFDWQ
jgi:hypothetical protein